MSSVIGVGGCGVFQLNKANVYLLALVYNTTDKFIEKESNTEKVIRKLISKK